MENRSKRKRKSESDDNSDDTAFAVVLAALSSLNPNSLRPLINKCLNKLHHSITDPTLSLLPTLLTFNSPAISRRAAEMVGSAALESLDMNQRIASDADIINSLLSALVSSNTGVSVAACNALLDLCTTGFGRRRLLDSSALPRILWEGFVHVALFSWNKDRKKAHNLSEYSSGIIHDISVNLLHAAIVLIGDFDSTFRKACLVASVFSQSHIHNWLDLNQRIIFCQLIDKIKIESQFLKVFRNVELAIQKSKDPFQRIRWLGFLNTEEENSPNCEQNMHLMGMKNLFTLCSQHKGKVEAAFQQLTSMFSSEVIFEDAIERYKMLLETYRKARKQYMNGMVSLHYEL